MEEIRIGLIGCGGMALGLASQAVELEGVSIAAVCDTDAGRAEAAAARFGAPSFDHYAKVLETPGVNAVIIATPNHLHADPAVDAARAGKHVFCEKPMATTLADCDRMIAAADSAGVKLMVGQVLRFFPIFRRTLEIAASGEVGVPRSAFVQRTGDAGSIFTSGWRTRIACSGGPLMEVSAHELDFLRQLCGDATRVTAQSRRVLADAPYDYDDTYFVQIDFAGGAVASLYASLADALGDYRMSIECTEGGIANGGFGGPIRYARFGGEPTVIQSAHLQMEDPYRHELRLFVEAIREDRPPAIPGSEGRAAVELALAAYRSAETGQPVDLPLRP